MQRLQVTNAVFCIPVTTTVHHRCGWRTCTLNRAHCETCNQRGYRYRHLHYPSGTLPTRAVPEQSWPSTSIAIVAYRFFLFLTRLGELGHGGVRHLTLYRLSVWSADLVTRIGLSRRDTNTFARDSLAYLGRV